MDGLCGAGHRDVLKMRSSLKATEVSDQHLAAPGVAVGAIPGAVESDANDGTDEVILCHTTGDVSMMVLNAKDR